MTDLSAPKKLKENIRLYRLPDLPQVELFQGADITRSFSRHRHWVFSISAIVKGKRAYYYQGKEYLAGPGDIKVICPGEIHATGPVDKVPYTTRSVRLEAAYFNALISQITGEGKTISRFSQPVIQDRDLYRQVIRLHQVLAGKASRLEKEYLLMDTLGKLVFRHAPAEYAESAEEGIVPVKAISGYIELNFNENLSLLDLARHFGFSPFHLVRQFTREMGIPPHLYQIQVRFRQAMELLAEGAPVAVVAAETGFFDQSHFTRGFKKKFGVTPSQFRADSSRQSQRSDS